jgi:hypothetical protein
MSKLANNRAHGGALRNSGSRTCGSSGSLAAECGLVQPPEWDISCLLLLPCHRWWHLILRCRCLWTFVTFTSPSRLNYFNTDTRYLLASTSIQGNADRLSALPTTRIHCACQPGSLPSDVPVVSALHWKQLLDIVLGHESRLVSHFGDSCAHPYTTSEACETPP